MRNMSQIRFANYFANQRNEVVPVRRLGPSSVLRCVDQSVASVVSVEALLQAVALPGSTLNDPDGT